MDGTAAATLGSLRLTSWENGIIKVNSTDQTLTEAELAATVGCAGYFTEIIAKDMAAQTPKLTSVESPHADYPIFGRPWRDI